MADFPAEAQGAVEAAAAAQLTEAPAEQAALASFVSSQLFKIMRAFLLLIVSVVAANAANYFVLDAGGTITNCIIAQSSFSPGPGLTKILVSALPTTAKVGDKWDGATLTPGNAASTQPGIKDWLASFGYDDIALLNLMDIQARLKDADVSLPTKAAAVREWLSACLLYTSPSPRDRQKSRMPSSA